MLSRWHVQVAITVAVAVWAAMLAVQGVDLEARFLRPYSLAVGAAMLVLIAYDRWLWRAWVVRSLSPRPVLHGTWKGTLTPEWTSAQTGLPLDPIPVFLAIRQTATSIWLSLLTPESTSVSLSSAIDVSRNECCTVSSTYLNTPQLLLQQRSPIHYGALLVEVHGRPPDRLVGSYWTGRKTLGQISLCGRSRRVHTDYDSARRDTY